MARSVRPGSKVRRTKAMMCRSMKPRRCSPAASKSGRVVRLVVAEFSSIVEDDVDVARWRNQLADGADHARSERATIGSVRGAETEREVRLEVAFRIEGARDAVRRNLRRFRDAALERTHERRGRQIARFGGRHL